MVLELVATIQILEDEGIDLIPDKAVASRNTVIHDREDFTLAIARVISNSNLAEVPPYKSAIISPIRHIPNTT